MRTDYDSDQTFEVIGPEDSHNETEVAIGLKCTANSFPGSFDPRWGGEPPSGPEFEVTTISLAVPRVNYKGEITGYDPPLVLSYEQFQAVVGVEVCEKIVDKAMEEAAERGGF